MAATEVELQELDQIAADLTKGCLSSSDDNIIMERCDFTPKNKSIEGQEVQDMNEYVMSYFESLNSMSRRIIAEHRQVIEENKEKWCNLSPEQQDRLIDDKIVDPKIRKKYGENRFDSKPEWFPVLKLAHGLSDSDRLNNPRDSIASVTFQVGLSRHLTLKLYTQEQVYFYFSRVLSNSSLLLFKQIPNFNTRVAC